MLLKLPCRFGEVFEMEHGGRKKEYMLTGFSHGLGATVDIEVSEFPAGGSRTLFVLDTPPAKYTLALPDDLYEHQSAANFGFPKKVKGELGHMALKDGRAVFAFRPASNPTFPFYSESPVLEELLRHAMPQPLTEEERLGMPGRALYTFQAHGQRMHFYTKNGADFCTAFSVLRDIMPLFRMNRDSRYHREILSLLCDRQALPVVQDQPILQAAATPLTSRAAVKEVCKRILDDLRRSSTPKEAMLFQPLYGKNGQLAARQFGQTAACQMHVTVDLDREQVSFHWNPLCYSKCLPADLTVGIAEGVDCLQGLAGEFQDAGQLAAAMEAPLRRLQSMALNPIQRADLCIDPEIMVGNDGFDFYIECWEGCDKRLGLELGPDDSVNIYGLYDAEQSKTNLIYVVHFWDSNIGKATQVPLTIQERKILESEMNKTCIRELGVSMDEFWRQEQALSQAPDPAGMMLQ